MNKTLIFAKRNVKEMLRSPASWGFGMIMPVGILTIMQIIMKSVGGDAAATTPMFTVDNFTGGVIVFGASFLTMFCVLLMSKDRSESFLSRLYASPMRASDYICGYAVALVPLMLMQVVSTFVVAMLFGLTISVNILVAILLSILSSLLFMALGIICGSSLSEKAAPPICSVIVQIAALFSGMWFPLDTMSGGFVTFCRVLPFANAYEMIRDSIAGDYSDIWRPLLIVLAYTLVCMGVAIGVFNSKMKKN